MSSINQAKAEAQKLIRKYNKLQAESKVATNSKEAKNKTIEANKLVSQICALQSAITKLQTKGKKTTNSQNAKKQSSTTTTPTRKSALEERMAGLEEAQRKTRSQIDQLNRAKAQLTHLKNQAEKSAVNVVKERRVNEEKLQQELANLIKKKEAEHLSLKQKLDKIREQARKDSELLKVQRDTARAMMEKQKQAEKEHSMAAIHKKGDKGILVGVIIGVIFSLILGGLMVILFVLPQEDADIKTASTSTQPKRYVIEKYSEQIEEPKKPKKINIKILGKFRDNLRNKQQGPLMIKLSGGTFMMGDKDATITHPDEAPEHQVTLSSFSISRYEITFAEYDSFIRNTGGHYPSDEGWGRKNRPVINVSWNDAVAYTTWLSKQTNQQYRLPSEREWEYAATTGIDEQYWWGYELGKNRANCGICGSEWDGKSTAPVGSFAPNQIGLYDVVGNVMEWTNSCIHYSYQNSPSAGQEWEGGNCDYNVVRGGSYASGEDETHLTKRILEYSPSFELSNLGFRIVRID
ncbi:MAG: SUMF1/EgtB/PvdO family nonheme iron enzyme [Thiomargarita sp.]|nr:SUMF1/EgtB/PvdO family nonheme iron enzyme [Thiomargarita sp.]